MTTPLEQMDLNTLFELVEQKAKKEQDGHFTLMKFTTGWKCQMGTPDLRGGDGAAEIHRLKSFPTVTGALIDLLLN
jgi:hypothetical protein